MIRKKDFLKFLIGLSVPAVVRGQSPPLGVWYDRPAGPWEETLPLGNGRLGMTADGGVGQEKIVLNDISLWSGSPQDANNYEAYKSLPRIREDLLEGKNDSAQALVDRAFICTGPGSDGVRYGCFQVLGNLHLQFGYGEGALTPVDTVQGVHAEAGAQGETVFDRYSRELSPERCGSPLHIPEWAALRIEKNIFPVSVMTSILSGSRRTGQGN